MAGPVLARPVYLSWQAAATDGRDRPGHDGTAGFIQGGTAPSGAYSRRQEVRLLPFALGMASPPVNLRPDLCQTALPGRAESTVAMGNGGPRRFVRTRE